MASTQTTSGIASTNPVANVTKQGTVTPAGVVNYNPNTGAKLGAGESVTVAAGGNTYGSNPVTTQSTTTLSSDKTADVANIQSKTDALSKTGITTNPDTGVPTYANGEVYVPPEPGSPATATTSKSGVSPGGYVGDTYYPQGSLLPTDANGNYSPTTDTSPTNDSILKSLNDQKASNDSLTASIISSIQAQYQTLIDQQTRTNAGAVAGTTNALVRSGALQHDVFSDQNIAAQVSYGTQQIADLNSKEQMAIVQAQQAGQQMNFQLQDKINSQISSIRQDKIDAATKLNQTILDQNKAIADRNFQVQQANTSTINNILTEAAKNGASSDILSAISSAKTPQDAITAAGDSLQSGTGTLGDYLQYKRDTEAQGLVPSDYQTYKDAQDAKDLQTKIKEAYATEAAKNTADANNTASDKVQQKLEQQYRTVLTKEFSARTGALGVENGKVNQANHLNALFMQYYDPKTGNYNIPTSQYAELAMGLANMISPTGSSSDADRAEIKAKTAAGDIKGAIQYITGEPQNGNTQAIIKNLVDSVDRQAETATRNRQAALEDMKSLAPTDLEPSRVDALNKATVMTPYEGQNRISKTNVDNYVKANPGEAENVAKLYEVAGATDKDIEDYLKAQGKIQ